VLAAALAACGAAALVALLHRQPALLAGGIAVIVFAATMMLGWGPRAGPVSFAPVLALVFTMSLPPGQGVLQVLPAQLAGAAVYVGWAVLSSRLLQRRYRTLALAAAVDATAALLRARAAAVAAGSAASLDTSRAWIGAEARLADRLQAARNLLFAARADAPVRRQCAILLRLIDLRDVVLASSVDLQRLDETAGARDALRSHLVAAADTLDACRDVVGGWAKDLALPTEPPAPAGAADGPELATRRRQLADDILHIVRLAQGEDEALPLSAEQLRRFVAPEGWPLRDLWLQARLASPVFRHALRAAVALSAAYAVAHGLPWAAHPQWLVLSVAVVLRGNLEQTLSRRNARVLGTMLGCMIVVLLAHLGSAPFAATAFVVAVGLAHGFALEQYLVTASAGTVMALLQAHAVAPATGFPIAERLADTLLGALLAWAFSFVLPSWERRGLPRALDKSLQALADYTRQALAGDSGDAAAPGLARRHAYDALGALTASLQRVLTEPAGVRPTEAALQALLGFVDQAQRLMAQVSMLRLVQARGDTNPDPAAQAALEAAAAALLQRREAVATAPPEPALPGLQRQARAVRAAAAAARTALAGAPPGSV